MPLPLTQIPLAPEQIARRYDSSIVVRRWGATWIDFLLLIFLVIAAFALPERLQPFAFLFTFLFALAYFVVLEHLFGRTLGKLMCRVRIVDSIGGRPSWGQAIIRTLLRVLEVNPALLGGIPAGVVVLSSKKRQRLGDMAASTFVLREEDARYLSSLREHARKTNLSHTTAPPGAPPPPPPLAPPPDTSTQWLLPTNRSGWAIAAGYLGLFAVLCIPAPFALVAGVLGLLEIGRTPGLGGRGRAIFGIVMGSLFSVILLILAVSALLGRA